MTLEIGKCELCERPLVEGQVWRLVVSMLNRRGTETTTQVIKSRICMECFRSLGQWLNTRQAGAQRRGAD